VANRPAPRPPMNAEGFLASFGRIGIIVLPSPDAKWSSIALDLRGSDLLGQARELNVFQLEGACPRFWAQMSETPGGAACRSMSRSLKGARGAFRPAPVGRGTIRLPRPSLASKPSAASVCICGIPQDFHHESRNSMMSRTRIIGFRLGAVNCSTRASALENRPAPLDGDTSASRRCWKAHGAAGSCSAISGCGGRGPLPAQWLRDGSPHRSRSWLMRA
jgi:hypothetical protein